MASLLRTSLLGLCLATTTLTAQAQLLMNNIAGTNENNSTVSQPFFCIQDKNGSIVSALQPGGKVDTSQLGLPYSYVGGALRFGGCNTNDSYLGYLGLDMLKHVVISYSAPEGAHVTLQNAQLSENGVLSGQMQYTPIAVNLNVPIAEKSGRFWPFVGVNLAGLEFGKSFSSSTAPNLSAEDAEGSTSDLQATSEFIRSGMNTVRLPIRWGYLQLEGPGIGDINKSYFDNFVKPTLISLTQAKVHVILDLHAYMRYSYYGRGVAGCGERGQCPDGDLILNEQAYQHVWKQLYDQIKADDQIDQRYLMLDIVNEPVEIPDDKVFTVQTAVIKTLRNAGFTGYILVEGNSWSGLHSWTTKTWASADGKIQYTNATLFTRENFAKAGITDLSKIIINVHQYFDNNYSGVGSSCLTDLSTTGPDQFNLQAFADYLKANQLKAIVTEFGVGSDSQTCSTALRQFLDYMKQNSVKGKDYGFIGWTIWSSGHAWGNYNLRMVPGDYRHQILQSYN